MAAAKKPGSFKYNPNDFNQAYNPLPENWQINFKGVFSMEHLYKYMYFWLSMRKFFSRDGNTVRVGDVNWEDYYGEVVLPGTQLKNLWIWWRCAKKENDMFTYILDIDMQTIALGTTEQVYKGQKFKLNDGEVTIHIKPQLVIDPAGKWVTTDDPDGKPVGDTFAQKWWPFVKRNQYWDQIDEREVHLTNLSSELYEEVKKFLGLYTLNKLDTQWYPETGYPQMQYQR